MEDSVIEALLTPWWKLPIILVVATICGITFRVAIKFDMNAWMRARGEAKEKKRILKIINECGHIWTLYSSSPYSRCDLCLALISTSLLLTARGFNPEPIISGEISTMLMTPGAGEIVINDYIGGRD